MKKTMLSLSAGLALALTGSANAAEPYLSELFWNPAGTDGGWERVEIAGDPGASLAGYWLIVMEGENVPAGVIDQLIDLSAYTIGSNGLLMISDDPSGVNILLPAPDPSTNVVIWDFSPDIENGANTFILAKGTPGFIVGQDFDAGPSGPSEIGDGVLDPGAIPGVVCVDAVGWIDAASTAVDYDYAGDPQIGFPGGSLGKPFTTTPDINSLFRVRTSDCKGPSGWAGGYTPTVLPGPFAWDAVKVIGFTTHGLDPLTAIPSLGSLNPCEAGAPACYPDCDGDALLTIDDFICFQTFFALSDPYADCDGDTALTIDDFICFQTFFAIGC
jgi:hypothetical protein